MEGTIEELRERMKLFEDIAINKLKRNYCGYYYWPDWLVDLLPHRGLTVERSSWAESQRKALPSLTKRTPD
jgi:hypothetical protein